MPYFKKVQSIEPLQALVDAPVRIAEVAVLLDTVENSIFGRVKFINQSSKDIVAIIVRLEAFNIAAEQLILEKPRFIYQDMIIKPGGIYGNKVALPLPEDTRMLNAYIDKVVFSDREVWDAKQAENCITESPLRIEVPEKFVSKIELILSNRLSHLEYVNFYYGYGPNFWHCTCGKINHLNNAKCSFCANSKKEQEQLLSQQGLEELIERIKKEEEEKRLAAEKALATNKKNKVLSFPHPLSYYDGICPYCGTKYYDNHNICIQCNAAFCSDNESAEKNTSNITTKSNTPFDSDNSKHRFRFKILIMLFVVIVLGLLAFVSSDVFELAKYGKITDAKAQSKIGDNYYYGNEDTKQNYRKALWWYQKAAKQGEMEAQAQLGVMYFHGYGTKKNYNKSHEWLKAAALQGHPRAHFNIGCLYRDGAGVEQSYIEAIEWYKKAAQLDDTFAINEIGCFYYNGTGVEKDYMIAHDYFLKAANAGMPEAQNNLGILYYLGLGVEKNYDEAFLRFNQAAEQGYADAQYNLGVMYAHGEAVDTNIDEAIAWYKKAAEQGQKKAIQAMKNISSLLTPTPSSVPQATVKPSHKNNSTVKHYCEQCSKEGTYSIEGLSGKLEYYCATHYSSLINMMGDMYSDSKSSKTHYCEECGKEAFLSISGLSGRQEYYCSTHYSELVEMFAGLF